MQQQGALTPTQWEMPLCQCELLQAFLHPISLEKPTLAIFSQHFVAFIMRDFLEVPSLPFLWCHFFPYLKLVPLEHFLRMNYQSLGSRIWMPKMRIILILCTWLTFKTLFPSTHTCLHVSHQEPGLAYPKTTSIHSLAFHTLAPLFGS